MSRKSLEEIRRSLLGGFQIEPELDGRQADRDRRTPQAVYAGFQSRPQEPSRVQADLGSGLQKTKIKNICSYFNIKSQPTTASLKTKMHHINAP